jgi:hypothetical protein
VTWTADATASLINLYQADPQKAVDALERLVSVYARQEWTLAQPRRGKSPERSGGDAVTTTASRRAAGFNSQPCH